MSAGASSQIHLRQLYRPLSWFLGGRFAAEGKGKSKEKKRKEGKEGEGIKGECVLVVGREWRHGPLGLEAPDCC